MQIRVSEADVVKVYQMLVDIVTPRPIAWVTTVDRQGKENLAPFSFFNAFGANPPVVVFSPTLRRDGTKKDTLLNLEETGEFVLNAAVESLANAVNQSSREIPRGESEIPLSGLTTIASVVVKPPRIAETPVSMECKVVRIVPVGNGPISANLVIGEVVYMHIDDAMIDPKGRIDPKRLRMIARLGGDYYCKTSDLFELKRP